MMWFSKKKYLTCISLFFLLLLFFLSLTFFYVLVSTSKEEENCGERSEGNVFHETPWKLFLYSLLEFHASRFVFEFVRF